MEVIKRNIYISPFWEEDLGALAGLIGVDHVLFGSDYPHPEGLADPASYLDELEGLDEESVAQDHGWESGQADERRRPRRPMNDVADAVTSRPSRRSWRPRRPSGSVSAPPSRTARPG